MQQGKLYFTVGLARSGKSTHARNWLRERSERPRAVVCGDDFRRAIHRHAYIPEAEGLVFATMDVAARALLLGGHDVLLDETATTEATILRYLRIDLDAQPVFVPTPEEVCIQRAIANGQEYLVNPIRRMASQLRDLTSDWANTFERLKAYVQERKVNDKVSA